MKLLTLYTITGTLFLQAFSFRMFSTFPGQKPLLKAVLDELCLPDIQCGAGYIGVDCLIKDTKIEGIISCHIKGKPGQSKRGINLMGDPENTGKYCVQSDYANYINTEYIQKCMNKCVDDALK
ncbi:hypothetical protein BB561_004381 [Smittium simulii]|uniref:Uncharacterized protein n=1 Tax=Smittium simulii TaxID=133385 RepID=A0A2T9YGM9_9FUNG|nr:hypothetical protein BB561_004381 [Smittium simulii]